MHKKSLLHLISFPLDPPRKVMMTGIYSLLNSCQSNNSRFFMYA